MSALLVDMELVEMLIFKEQLLQKVGVGMSAFLVDILIEEMCVCESQWSS